MLVWNLSSQNLITSGFHEIKYYICTSSKSRFQTNQAHHKLDSNTVRKFLVHLIRNVALYFLWLLQLCKEVAPNISLPGVCRHLVSCHYYQGVVELVLECAAKYDPRDMALHYFSTNQPIDDTLGRQAYCQRYQKLCSF